MQHNVMQIAQKMQVKKHVLCCSCCGVAVVIAAAMSVCSIVTAEKYLIRTSAKAAQSCMCTAKIFIVHV